MDKKNPENSKKCQACEGLKHALSAQEVQEHLKQISDWQVSDDRKSLSRKYVLKNFITAIQFTNDIARLAEKENHHPDIHLTNYRNVRIDLSTHAVNGLSENDFILARQINNLHPELKQ